MEGNGPEIVSAQGKACQQHPRQDAAGRPRGSESWFQRVLHSTRSLYPQELPGYSRRVAGGVRCNVNKKSFNPGINHPPQRSESKEGEGRKDTFHQAILAKPIAPGHAAAGEHYPVSRRKNADADATVRTNDSRAAFEQLFLQHLDAAYNLARLLTRNAHDAEDVVQESYLKAFRAFPEFRGAAARPWILTIVRNTSFTWLRDNRGRGDGAEYHEELHVSGGPTPEAESLGRERSRALQRCIEHLPSDFREAIVLREMEELSYQEIAEITGVPAGTVMSRLSRGRARLTDCLKNSLANNLWTGRKDQ